ncbi:MAG: site-specific integrase [Rubrivivax sp.]
MAQATQQPSKSNIRVHTSMKGVETFHVQLRRKNLEPVRKRFENRVDAEQFVKKFQTEADKVLRVKRPDPLTVREASLREEKLIDVMYRFLKSDVAKQRHKNITPTIARHIGDVKLKDINKTWVKAYIRHMRNQKSRRGKPFADTTIGAHIWTMNVMVEWQADELDVPRLGLPLTVAGLPGNWDVKRDRRLDQWEEDALMERLQRIKGSNREQWMLLIPLAINTAARLSELIKCQWKEIHLDRRVWIIQKKNTKVKKERAVPLTKTAVAILTKLKEMAEVNGTHEPASRVFFGIGEKANSVSMCFRRYAKQAGLTDFRFHDLRHEAISRMVLKWRTFTLAELMIVVGHTRSELFQRYANLRADELASRVVDL